MKPQEQYKPKVIPSYVDIDSETYHSSVGISSSGLKLLKRTPKHYWSRYEDPAREAKEDTPALLLGKQIHMAVLEPAKYLQTYYPLPEKYNRSTKQGKADYEWHESEAKKAGQELISKESHEICQRIAEEVHQDKTASFLFDQRGMVEKSFYWTDPATGVLCKCRPDKLIKVNGKIIILDLKSSTDASPQAFERDEFNLGYYLSAEFYRQGVAAVSGQEIGGFVFCVYEKEPPYACAFYEADAELLGYAQAEISKLLEIYSQCSKTGIYPGYPQGVMQLSLPRWAKPKVGAA